MATGHHRAGQKGMESGVHITSIYPAIRRVHGAKRLQDYQWLEGSLP